MINFNPNLVKEAFKIVHEAHELSDVANDINRIDATLSDVPNGINLMKARMSDVELRNKYPTIAKMIAIANGFSVATVNSQSRLNDLPEHTNLKQDYYGILCDVLLKKRITTSIEQFIETVD